MSGPSDANPRAIRRFRWTYFATTLGLLVIVGLLGSDLPAPTRSGITDFSLLLGGLAAGASCGYRGLHSVGRRRRAWFILAIAGGLAVFANLVTLLLTALSISTAVLVNISYILPPVLSIAALVTFPSVARRRADITRMVLDGVVLGGSGLFIISVTVFPQLLHTGEAPLSQAIVLLLPTLDIVLSTLAVLLILRSDPADRPALALVSVGFLLYAVSDLSFAVLSSQGPFNYGSVVDIGWITGYALIALAACKPPGVPRQFARPAAETSPVIGTIVMFGLFLAAAFASLGQMRAADMSSVLVIMWLGVLLAVIGRQLLLVIDNEALRRGLERRVVERTVELRQITRQSELLLSSVGDGIYGVDRGGYVTFINPAAADALGYRPEEVIGLHAHDAFHGDGAEGDALSECTVAIAINEGRTTAAEEGHYRRANGREIPVEVTTSPLSRDHDVEGAVVVFRDVTNRREVDRMKGEFVSMVSHELRTPLTSIRGSLGLLSGGAFGELPPSMSRMVNIALESSERLTRLVNDILDVERIEAGMMPLHLDDHDVEGLVTAATSQVQVLAAQAGVTVNVKHTEGRVRADADRVIQTLINLLGNAIKFSTSGTVVDISTRVTGEFVEFKVVDNGPGVPEDQLDRIFDRFQQADSSDTRGGGGSGLGLAISRSIVERHGGTIWVESELGKGTTFRFTMPTVDDTTTRTVDPSASETATTLSGGSPDGLSRPDQRHVGRTERTG